MNSIVRVDNYFANQIIRDYFLDEVNLTTDTEQCLRGKMRNAGIGKILFNDYCVLHCELLFEIAPKIFFGFSPT